MRKFIIILFLALNSVYIIAQSSSVEMYHNLINRAEISITKFDLNISLLQYDSAFHIFTPFALDLNNAFVVAYKLGNNDMMEYCANKLIERGTPLKFFDQYRFKKLLINEKWKQFINTKSDSLIQLFTSNIDQEYRSTLKALMELDQSPRGPNHNEDKINKVEATIKDSLLYLVKLKGYPSESKVGIWFSNDSLIKYNPIFEFLVLHQFQCGNGEHFIDIMKEAVFAGQLKPLKLSFYAGYLPNDGLNFGCISHNQFIYCQLNEDVFKCSEEKMVEVDKVRSIYFLESLKDVDAKVRFYTNVCSDFRLNIFYSCLIRQVKDNQISKTIGDLEQKGFKRYVVLPKDKMFFTAYGSCEQ